LTVTNLRNSWKIALWVTAILVAAQIAASISVRTTRVRNYFSARLEDAFGRPVQVKHFNIEILPSPRIYASGVTVAEDPAFGYEYFLRAEQLTAGLRWSGFLRGRFEFGTLSLGQPSLTLVRNSEGRWNLEDWLPPAKRPGVAPSPVYGPSRAPTIANRLEKIEIDDGRINFKKTDIKQPFALISVSGSVEQISPGRWKLAIEAQPWRSGVSLQSAGTVQVRGDIAGTSARLQPASLGVHWTKVSLADLFRLLHGKDYGVRGTFELEATAKSGAPPDTTDTASVSSSNDSFVGGDWSYSLKASAAQIHRWDLTERPDNPEITANVQGRCNVALKKLVAEALSIQTPLSNLHGAAEFLIAANPFMRIQFESASIQAADILSWYRAFHPDVSEAISADQFFTGSLRLRGWPLEVQEINLSSSGGAVNLRSTEDVLRIGPFHTALNRNRLVMDPIHVALVSSNVLAEPPVAIGRLNKLRASGESIGEASLTLVHDFASHSGGIGIQGHVDNAEKFLKIAASFGRTLNRGWDLTGPARVDMRSQWSSTSSGAWSGAAEVTDAELAAAGLNQPVQLQKARLEWKNGNRVAQIGEVEGFGATWSGNIAEVNSTNPDRQGVWNVQLHADHLDATELDRWVGPRARPGWVQRLLPSLFSGKTQRVPASELVRRLNVIGNVQVDEFTIEKLKLQQLHLQGSLHDLQLNVSDGRAQWAGGTVRATMLAKFLPRPLYDVHAQWDGVNLTQLPIDVSVTDRLAGLASGAIHLKTTGVGREELLQKLTGAGKVRLDNLEFRGWDVNASVADGEAHPGISNWPSGVGTFTVRDRNVFLADVRLDGGTQFTLIDGMVSFGREADLAIETSAGRRAVRNATGPGHVLKIVGPLDGPRVTREKSAPRQPAD
jgi:AsmA family